MKLSFGNEEEWIASEIRQQVTRSLLQAAPTAALETLAVAPESSNPEMK